MTDVDHVWECEMADCCGTPMVWVQYDDERFRRLICVICEREEHYGAVFFKKRRAT